jgi:hypothetical protein
MQDRDIFISHSSIDRDAARELRDLIRSIGYSSWLAPDDVVGSGTWTQQILEAIDKTRAMVVVLSRQAVE